MNATLFVDLPFEAYETKARLTQISRGLKHGARRAKRRKVRFAYSKSPGSGGVRAFGMLLPHLRHDTRRDVCGGLSRTEDELYDRLKSATRVHDLRTADSVVEELKFVSGSRRLCKL